MKKNKTKGRYPREHWENLVRSEVGYELLDVMYEQRPLKETWRLLTFLLVRTPNGKEIKVTPAQWKNGVRSNYNRTVEDLRPTYQARGYRLLEDKYKTAKTKMRTLCPNGHEFLMHWNHFQQGVGCPQCYGTPQVSIPEIQERIRLLEIDKKIELGYQALRRIPNNRRLAVEFKCPQNHLFVYELTAFFSRHDRCPECGLKKKTSQAELEILRIIQERYPSAHKNKNLGIELDVFIPEIKLAIEYCGLYWHCELFKGRNHHYAKYLKCKEAGIQLLTIFEDEWFDKKDIILRKILPLPGLHARHTVFETLSVDESRSFLTKYHLQGASMHSKHHFGLRHEQELVAVATFGPHHRRKDNEILVLDRLCFGPYAISGGAEKLFKNAINLLPKLPIVSWSDNRYSYGNMYQRLGFSPVQQLRPDYSYCRPGQNPIRVSKQSMKKKQSEKLSGKTENELRAEQGWYRIWDCGKIRWEYTPV